MAHLTDVPGLLGLFGSKVAAVIDAFSRMPLAAQVFCADPPSSDLTELFRKTAKRFGKPRHFVPDQGAQFTAHVFREFLKALGVRQRFGAIGETGSIALIERFWRSLKGISGVRASSDDSD